MFKSHPDGKEFPKKNSGSYGISFKDCGKVYIGQTKRNLDTHMKEHIRDVKSHQTDKSTVTSHVWEDRIEAAKLLLHI